MNYLIIDKSRLESLHEREIPAIGGDPNAVVLNIPLKLIEMLDHIIIVDGDSFTYFKSRLPHDGKTFNINVLQKHLTKIQQS